MDLERWLRIATRHRTILVLLALLSTFAGADLLLNRPKGPGTQGLAVSLVACGAALFAWTVWPRGVTPTGTRASLAARFLNLATLHGRLIPYFPILGIAIVVADLVYNTALSASPTLLTEDTIVLLGAGALISYGFVPNRFVKERDFVLVFFIMLNAVLVVPLLIARAFYADFERSVDVYSWVALAPETGAVGLTGMPSAAMVVGDGGSKKRGKLGRSNETPPWMFVSWPGLPRFAATASW